MKPRIIGVESCKNCRRLKKSYENQKVDFEYWDGEKKELQKKLDEMNIDDFPVVQIIDDNGTVVYPYDQKIYPKGVSYARVKSKIEELKKHGK